MSEFKNLKGFSLILAMIFGLFLPPVCAYMRTGFNKHFWINIVLCFLGWLPAVVHNIWLVFFTEPKISV